MKSIFFPPQLYYTLVNNFLLKYFLLTYFRILFQQLGRRKSRIIRETILRISAKPLHSVNKTTSSLKSESQSCWSFIPNRKRREKAFSDRTTAKKDSKSPNSLPFFIPFVYNGSIPLGCLRRNQSRNRLFFRAERYFCYGRKEEKILE